MAAGILVATPSLTHERLLASERTVVIVRYIVVHLAISWRV
jgi:hypothetical protein